MWVTSMAMAALPPAVSAEPALKPNHPTCQRFQRLSIKCCSEVDMLRAKGIYYTDTYTHTCVHAYMHICIYAYMHICIKVYM